MAENKIPENIRQMIDLVSAVIRRINEKRLDNAQGMRLCMTKQGGMAT